MGGAADSPDASIGVWDLLEGDLASLLRVGIGGASIGV